MCATFHSSKLVVAAILLIMASSLETFSLRGYKTTLSSRNSLIKMFSAASSSQGGCSAPPAEPVPPPPPPPTIAQNTKLPVYDPKNPLNPLGSYGDPHHKPDVVYIPPPGTQPAGSSNNNKKKQDHIPYLKDKSTILYVDGQRTAFHNQTTLLDSENGTNKAGATYMLGQTIQGKVYYGSVPKGNNLLEEIKKFTVIKGPDVPNLVSQSQWNKPGNGDGSQSGDGSSNMIPVPPLQSGPDKPSITITPRNTNNVNGNGNVDGDVNTNRNVENNLNNQQQPQASPSSSPTLRTGLNRSMPPLNTNTMTTNNNNNNNNIVNNVNNNGNNNNIGSVSINNHIVNNNNNNNNGFGVPVTPVAPMAPVTPIPQYNNYSPYPQYPPQYNPYNQYNRQEQQDQQQQQQQQQSTYPYKQSYYNHPMPYNTLNQQNQQTQQKALRFAYNNPFNRSKRKFNSYNANNKVNYYQSKQMQTITNNQQSKLNNNNNNFVQNNNQNNQLRVVKPQTITQKMIVVPIVDSSDYDGSTDSSNSNGNTNSHININSNTNTNINSNTNTNINSINDPSQNDGNNYVAPIIDHSAQSIVNLNIINNNDNQNNGQYYTKTINGAFSQQAMLRQQKITHKTHVGQYLANHNCHNKNDNVIKTTKNNVKLTNTLITDGSLTMVDPSQAKQTIKTINNKKMVVHNLKSGKINNRNSNKNSITNTNSNSNNYEKVIDSVGEFNQKNLQVINQNKDRRVSNNHNNNLRINDQCQDQDTYHSDSYAGSRLYVQKPGFLFNTKNITPNTVGLYQGSQGSQGSNQGQNRNRQANTNQYTNNQNGNY